jgi:hypothetical protein
MRITSAIKDVLIELQFPARFLVINGPYQEALDRYMDVARRERLPTRELEANAPAVDKLLDGHSVTLAGDAATVRYDIGP